MADTPDLHKPSSARRSRPSVLRSGAVEAVLFTGALVVVAFNEILGLIAAPAKMAVKGLSYTKIMDDLHTAEHTLKKSRLVKNITGKIPPWIPATLMMGLLVGIPAVAILAKGALLLHLTALGPMMAKVPLIGQFIGTTEAAVMTLFKTAIFAKIAKLPAVIIATCCPQFIDSTIHQKINTPIINKAAYFANLCKDYVVDHTKGLRRVIGAMRQRLANTWPMRAAAYVASGIKGVISSLIPKRKEPALVDPASIHSESHIQTAARTALHTVLVYGSTLSIPAATTWSAMLAYGAGKTAVASTAAAAGLGMGSVLTYTAIGVGIAAAGAVGGLALFGGIYGAARMSRSLFARAGKGVCEPGEGADAATAQAMHEGLLIGTAATFGVVEHYIHAKEALLGTVGAGTTAALLGGWKKIHAEYKRINEAKQEFAQRYAADPQAFAKPPQRMFRDMFASSLPGASRTAVEQRLATVSKALKAKLLARAQKLPVTKSDLASLHDHGTLRVAMKRLLRASRPVKDAQAKRDSTRTHYRHA